MFIAENTTKPYGGKAMPVRFSDLIEPKPAVEKKSAEQIIAEVNKACGLTMIEEEGEI